jgi:hypothetical protein
MSINIANISAVAGWIAQRTVTGLTIQNLDNLPEAVNPQDCPMLVPDLDAPFVTDFSVTRLSFRDSTYGRNLQIRYTLHYTLFYALVSEGVSLFEQYHGMVDMWSAVVTELVKGTNETPTSAYDFTVNSLDRVGAVADPIGAQFHGAKFTVSVIEMARGE